LFSQAIRAVVEIGWPDMLTHYRLLKLNVEALGPAVVAIDAHGNSVYADVDRHARAKLAAARAQVD
jgi:fumarate hydratase subunit beta